MVRSRVRGPTAIVRGPTTIVRGPTTRVGGPTTRVRCPTARVRGPTTIVRGLTTRVRGPTIRVFGSTARVYECTVPPPECIRESIYGDQVLLEAKALILKLVVVLSSRCLILRLQPRPRELDEDDRRGAALSRALRRRPSACEGRGPHQCAVGAAKGGH